MRRPNGFRILGLPFLLALLISAVLTSAPAWADSAGPEALQALSIQEPNGTNDKIREEDDFATVVLGDAWDMNEPTDLYSTGLNNQPDHGFAGIVLANGFFTGTTEAHDSSLWLLHQGYNDEGSGVEQTANNIDLHSGIVNPIDATHYTHLSFRMYRNDPDPAVPVRVFWYHHGDEMTGLPCGTSAPMSPYAGWHVYHLDLSQPANWDVSSCPWTGQIIGLRLAPTATDRTSFKNKLISLDWVRLTHPLSAAPYTISWNSGGSAGDRAISLFLDNDNNIANDVVDTIATDLRTTSIGSYTWATQGFPPGNYYVHANMGLDYGGVVRNDPWDFVQTSDYQMVGGLNNYVLANGMLQGTTSSADPWIWLNTSAQHPVNAGIYHVLVVRMKVDRLVNVNAYWTRLEDANIWSNASAYTTVEPGDWRIVKLNLGEAEHVANGSWSGLIKDLRFDPGTAVGIGMQIDWISLSTDDGLRSEAELAPIQATSPGTLTINESPRIQITAPSMQSGDDYATTMLGAPWNFDDATTLSRMAEIESATYDAHTMHATTARVHAGCPNDCGDPQLWFKISEDPRQFINTERFKYLTVRYRQDGVQNVEHGWVMRLLWTPTTFPDQMSTLDDIVLRDDWPFYNLADGNYQTYQMDLTRLRLEPGGGANLGWTGKVAQLRLDPNEIAQGSTFHIKQALLTADPVTSGLYNITWRLSNLDDRSVVAVYFDTDRDPAAKTRIGSVEQPANNLAWDTTDLPAGQYYIYVEANDGFNTVGRYADVPVIVQKTAAFEFTNPGSESERLLRGDEYGRDVWGRAWDMSSAASTDEGVQGGITTPVFEDGVMSFSTTTADPYFWLPWSITKTIDASKYKTLYFRMYSSQSSQAQVFWYDTNENPHGSDLILTLSGWQTYRLDLSQYGTYTGALRRIRIDPALAPGINIEVDWVKLTDPTSALYTTTWTATHADQARVTLSVSGAEVPELASTPVAWDLAPVAGQAQVDLSWLDPGYYWFEAAVDDQKSPVVHKRSPGQIKVVPQSAPTVDLSGDQIYLRTSAQHSQANRYVTLDNSGLLEYTWSITSSLGMVSVSPASGSHQPDQISVLATVPAGTPPGDYSATLLITAVGVGTRSIDVHIHNIDTPLSYLYLPVVNRQR